MARKNSPLDRAYDALKTAALAAIHDGANAVEFRGQVLSLAPVDSKDLQKLLEVNIQGHVVSLGGTLKDRARAAESGVLGDRLRELGAGILRRLSQDRHKRELRARWGALYEWVGSADPSVLELPGAAPIIRSLVKGGHFDLPATAAAARAQGIPVPPCSETLWSRIAWVMPRLRRARLK